MIRVGGWIQTHPSNIAFYPLDPRPEDICVEDICWALSNICRFVGHVSTLYSVGEHCVRVSYEVERRWIPLDGARDERTRNAALAGLLHDASEAYLSDVARPIKIDASMARYRVAEHVLERMIFEKFGVLLDEHLSALVHHVDTVLLMTERRDLKGEAPQPWSIQAQPLAERIDAWSPELTRARFMARFRELSR